jgi:hypothetical protein
MSNKIQEGLESIERIKLLMGYSLNKTLTENREDIIKEQIDNVTKDIGNKLISALSNLFNDDEEEVLKQINRVNSKEVLDKLNQYIKTKKGLTLVDYINDEMSDIDSEYRDIFNHLIKYDSSYEKGYKGSNKLTKVIGTYSQSGPTVISEPTGVDTTGPYRVDDNLLWKDEKMLYTQNGDANGYFIIKNNSKQKLLITSVNSTYNVGKVISNFFTSPINPGGQTKVLVKVKSQIFEKVNFNKPIDTNRMAVDATYVAPKTYPKSNEKITPKTNQKPSQSDILIINTNLGEIKLKLKFDYNDATKAQIKALDKYNNGLSVPGGYRVIEGISPFEYDEFLGKVKNLSNQSGCKSSIGSVYNKLVNGEDTNLGDYISEQSVIGVPNRGVISKPSENEKVRWECQSKLKEIFNEYSNRKFPKGITKEDLKDFNSQKETINKEILNWQNAHKKPHKAKYWTDEFGVREKIQDEGYYFDEKLLTSSEKEEYKKLKAKIEELEQYYGYDGRSEFDKFMDSGWGQLAQFGAVAALMIAGFFTEGATWVVAADLLLNLSIGSYYLNRGNTREALMYFIFAGMGGLHKFYNVINNGIKTAGVKGIELTTVSKSIASKMVGLTFDSPQALNSFMYGVLNKSERVVFREVLRTLKTQPKVVQESLETLSKEVAQARGVYKNLSWAEAQKIVNFKGAQKFASNTLIDLAITIPKVQEAYDHIKSEFKKKGVDITWGERDHKILEYLSQNKTESEIKKIKETITFIASKLTAEEAKYYADELNNKTKKEEFAKISEMTQSQINNKIKSIKDTLAKINKDVESDIQKRKDIDAKARAKIDAFSFNEEEWLKITPEEVNLYKVGKKCQVFRNKGEWFVKKSGCDLNNNTTIPK